MKLFYWGTTIKKMKTNWITCHTRSILFSFFALSWRRGLFWKSFWWKWWKEENRHFNEINYLDWNGKNCLKIQKNFNTLLVIPLFFPLLRKSHISNRPIDNNNLSNSALKFPKGVFFSISKQTVIPIHFPFTYWSAKSRVFIRFMILIWFYRSK